MMIDKFVLVACEESQAVCKAFRDFGCIAFSCDLQPCSGGHPEWHIISDALLLINGFCSFCTMDGITHSIERHWDLIVAHPPCTYLSNAGARWLYPGGVLSQSRYNLGLSAKQFFLSFLNSDCEHVCIENPLPSKVYELPCPSQIIQPYDFGEPFSKTTLLWLRGLPPLMSTDILCEYKPYINSSKFNITHDDFYKGVSRSGGSSRIRSKTFSGIANAMAAQWIDFI